MPKQTEKLDENWERDALRRLAFATLNEQRRARRWRIFFVLLFLIYLFVSLVAFLQPDLLKELMDDEAFNQKHTAVVEVKGVIDADSEASADHIVSGLRKAFKDDKTAGIIIRINSPGGSPVQAGYIYNEIKRLRKKYPKIPLYAVVTDMCASGGYYIAAAADKIYADQASLVGSIGVLMNGFGFVGAMDKLGIERRLLTAGEHKGFLDSFSAMKPEDIAHVKGMLNEIHQQFITRVKEGREKSLKAAGKLALLDNPELFSGLIWTGEKAMQLGLVDKLASTSEVAREIIKAEKIKDFSYKRNYLDRFADRLGATMASTLAQQLKFNSGAIQ
jgi:protease-4